MNFAALKQNALDCFSEAAFISRIHSEAKYEQAKGVGLKTPHRGRLLIVPRTAAAIAVGRLAPISLPQV